MSTVLDARPGPDVVSDPVAAARPGAVRAALTVAMAAACGAAALEPFQGAAAPRPLVAGAAAGLLAWPVIRLAHHVGGEVGRRVAWAMCLLTTIGWVVQSRAPISQAANGGSTIASSAALLGTPVWACAAAVAFVVALFAGHRVVHWRWWGGPVGAAVVLGLLLAPLAPGIGSAVNGVHSWVAVGPIRFQPGDLGRVALVLFLAAHLEGRTLTLAIPGRARLAERLGLGSAGDLLRVFGLVAVAIGLLLVQDDLGPAILVVAVAAALAWAVTGRVVYPAAAVLAFVGGCAAVITLGGSMAAKVSGRLDAWFDPFGAGSVAKVNGVALQAQARGGLTGVGLGRSFDPYWVAARNDYILPQVALRLGLVGVVLVAVLVAVIVRGLLTLSAQASERGRLVALGAACAIGFQSVLIAAGSTSAFALTGVAFPFLSYGGTSLVASALLVGLAIAGTSAPPLVLPVERTRVPARSVIGLVLLVLAFAVGAKCVATATVDASTLAHRRDNPWNRQPVSLERGRILSADGVVLARSVRRNGTWTRQYPLGPATAGVVGWVSRSGNLGGAEAAYDEDLRAGRDVRLTIVAAWQQAAYRSLVRTGRSGSAVAIDHRTGAIRVLVSTPSFDPAPLASPDPKVAAAARERLLADPANPLLVGAYQQRYLPGSIFKLVDVQAAIDAGLDPHRSYPVRRAWTPPGGSSISNADGMACGGDLARMLEVSCNTTATAVGAEVGIAQLRRAADQLGLHGAPTLDLPQVAQAGFPTTDDPFHAALAAIGQGDVAISPLQAALMAAAGTEGQVPGLVLRAADPSGDEGASRPPAAAGADRAARQTIRSGMAACLADGTCTALQGTAARYAKTGTAEVDAPGGPPRRNAWMVAVSDHLAVSALVRGEPGQRVHGGQDAAPVARALLVAATHGEGGN